jgi:6,7-dimethyl-8-ribityllumazine synthase
MEHHHGEKMIKTIQGKVEGDGLLIGVVTARFNPEITTLLEAGALKVLKASGISDKNIFRVSVPGAVEIPLAVKALFKKKKVSGVIALGAVIRGETSHYDYVCQSVERGCSTISLKYNKPVSFGVLTTENEEQAKARVGGIHGHKGEEAALVVLEMCDLLRILT